MPDPLSWKLNKGFDVHILRNGPSSTDLDQDIDKDPNSNDPLTFTIELNSANDTGTGVTSKGAVSATNLGTGATEVRNFLLRVNQGVGLVTYIRVHVHSSIQKIWVTPTSISAYNFSDESRFTVLALFDDGVVGDITDWPQLKYQSSDKTIIDVDPTGLLKAVVEASSNPPPVDITVSLDLTTPPLNLKAVGKGVYASNSWRSFGAKAKIEFIDGPVRPDPTNLGGTAKNSVPKVVNDQTNILFISEGFKVVQAKDFSQLVKFVVTRGLKEQILEPFGMLADSINYWSAFIPSPEDGITLLGEYSIGPTNKRGGLNSIRLEQPEKPSPTAIDWTLENMMFNLGLPAPNDPNESITDAVQRWNKVYTLSPPVTDAMVKNNYRAWTDLRKRTIPNERSTVFGLCEEFRPRVSFLPSTDPLLGLDSRRVSQASLDDFIGKLEFGEPQGTDSAFGIGETWTRTNKDAGLICFLCLCERDAGEAVQSSFAVAAGYERVARLKAVTYGMDVLTDSLGAVGAPYNDAMTSRTVAHECGHALGLGDEYGPATTHLIVGQSPFGIFPNLQVKFPPLVTGTNPEIYDAKEIKWLFPRTFKLGVLNKAPVPDPSNVRLFTVIVTQVQPAKTFKGTAPFALGDRLMIRQVPFKKSDPFFILRFLVTQVFTNGGLLIEQDPGGTPLDPALFDPNMLTLVFCVNRGPGQPELKIIADKITSWIETSHGPLTAPLNNPGAACDPSNNKPLVQTPTNLDFSTLTFKKSPPSKADILGLYEGGGHFDCGIFRPAGRCNMRASRTNAVPFCHVCRFLIIDRVNALKLIDLDAKYDPFYPS